MGRVSKGSRLELSLREAAELWAAMEDSGARRRISAYSPLAGVVVADVFKAQEVYREESTGLGTGRAYSREPAVESEYVFTSEAARILGISLRGVQKRIDRDQLPATKEEGRWRIPRAALR